MSEIDWPAATRIGGQTGREEMASLRKAMDLHHPMARPHDYLWLLGVTPAAQGKGVGSRLLTAGLARVDAQRRPAFLETSTEANVALYRRHGFEVIDEYWVRPDSKSLSVVSPDRGSAA